MTATVDVWFWRLSGGDVRRLSPDERARAAAFVFDRDRDRYVAGRARLREILGGHLGLAPGALQFRYEAHGKPAVEGVEFNLSHTGDLAALAISPRLQLGVDIEAVRPIEESVARTHFAPAEHRTLMRMPEADRLAAFYRCWTRKEAYLKARGTGLSTDLASFEVTLDAASPPRLLQCASGEAAAWRLIDLATPCDGVAGALAARTGGGSIELRIRSE